MPDNDGWTAIAGNVEHARGDAVVEPDPRCYGPSMTQPIREAGGIDTSHLVTDDGLPVDNLYSEKAQSLLRDALYASWLGPDGAGRFVVMVDVGIFAVPANPGIAPDVLVAVDVEVPPDPRTEGHRSYFTWLYGKPPDVVVEIVSNKEGGELSTKLRAYERLRVAYYIVYDPSHHLSDQDLYVFALQGKQLTETASRELAGMGLGVTLWTGNYEGCVETWLRWTNDAGQLLLTGRERADVERSRAEAERDRAEAERDRADRLAAKLREMGVDPE